MARIPLLTDAEVAPVVTEIFETMRKNGGRPPNLYRALGHSPSMLKAWIGLAWPLRFEPKLSRALRELVILRVAQITEAHYEEHHHTPMARAAGVTEQQITELPRWRDSKAFSEAERAAIAYAEAVTAGKKVPDAIHAELKRLYDPEGIVEITLTAAFYNCVSRILLSLEIDLET
jgi:AhpD family alkylhydroperoxidase